VSARVTNDDPRYDEWLTASQLRSQRKAQKREREAAFKVGARVAQQAAPLAVPAARRAVASATRAAETARRGVARVAATRVATGIGTGAVGIGTAAGLAILAGAAAYFGTTWIMDRVRKLTDPEERAFQLATAYRQARARAARELGRALTAEEVQYLGAELNAQLVKMGIRH